MVTTATSKAMLKVIPTTARMLRVLRRQKPFQAY